MYVTTGSPIGTVKRITAVITGDPDSARITIIDPEGTTRASAAAMTENPEGTFTYTFQTSADWPVGVYCCAVSAIKGTNTAIEKTDIEFY